MGTWRQLTVTGVAVHGSVLLVALDGVAGRDAAESLRGAHVLVPAGDLPPPEAGEFYWHEVVGFAVDTPSGEHLGTITGTLSTGLHDVWTVRHGEREYLIPVIGDVVRAIDRHARRVVVEPLPGLLE
jgi:16S rRNA processing protein RimM